MLVGLAALIGGYHFGRAHHALYFIVTVTILGGLLVARDPLLLVTLICLLLLSRFRARSFWHPFFAVVGAGPLLAVVIRAG